MKTAQLGDYFKWNGQVVKCEWINNQHKSIGFKTNEVGKCPHCGGEYEYVLGHDVIESSRQFQDGAEPINSISDK